MLNKLLKRCMPWMDKGRWYKIVLNPSGGTFVIGAGTDPAFQNVGVTYDHNAVNGYTTFALSNADISVVDVKTRFFIGSMSGYASVDFTSSANNTLFVFHDPISIRPGDGLSLEILVYGR